MHSDRFANRYGLTFHHLRLAVKTPATTQAFLSALGYRVGATVCDPLQNVHPATCEHPLTPPVEIICPGHGQGPIDRYLQPHKEGLVHHMGFAAQDLNAAIAALKADPELRAIFRAKPQEAALFQGRKVAFFIVLGLGLIELVAERL